MRRCRVGRWLVPNKGGAGSNPRIACLITPNYLTCHLQQVKIYLQTMVLLIKWGLSLFRFLFHDSGHCAQTLFWYECSNIMTAMAWSVVLHLLLLVASVLSGIATWLFSVLSGDCCHIFVYWVLIGSSCILIQLIHARELCLKQLCQLYCKNSEIQCEVYYRNTGRVSSYN